MSQSMQLFTIGFTKKTAQAFFETLIQAGVKRIIDVRLHNVSQLAGFAKRHDLEYFLQRIGGIGYVHALELAPTADILADYKQKQGNWSVYEDKFLQLMRDRQIETTVSADLLAGSCLLCSEAQPHYCHRRLVAEYLQQHWGNLDIHHL